MPLLNCSAVKCVYNKNEYCSKADIQVGGEDAQTSDETCCASFKERGHDSASNSTGETASAYTQVQCEACTCVHNDQEECHADAIDICGCNACDCMETKCGTYK
ncbi:MAG: DUF1540 domain-containing protein [Lachnospiraceae bacterium]|jgi:hypothetical protein|nr:DUF1540 domain-containing protein [Lachnospiraceae bacterium]MDD3615602.1 DUF1540 domain-containing protein [Lachnospiraceae bacterium]